jgi:hypothetical protein
MRETEAVAQATAKGSPKRLADKAWTILQTLPDATHASMLDDLNAGQRNGLGCVVAMDRDAIVVQQNNAKCGRVIVV